jgi:hypothetical protein
MKQVYLRHNVDTPYIKKNYKDTLASLELSGNILASPAARDRRKIKGNLTFADDVMVTFSGGDK